MSEVNVLTRTEDPVGTIAMPYQETIEGEALVSFMRADFRWAQGRDPDYIYVRGSQLPSQRNLAVHRMRGEWLLFVDSDMSFEPDAIGSLVSSYHRLLEEVDEPVMLGGLCNRRYPPFQPTVFHALDMQEGPFRCIEDWEGQDYVEVDATGMAFVLIGVRVFEAIMGGPMPPVEERMQLEHPWPYFEWVGYMGEDFRFCLKARNAGCRIFVDTRIHIKHWARLPVGLEDFYQQVALRTPELEAEVRAANEEAGIPTLTAEEARRRLG